MDPKVTSMLCCIRKPDVRTHPTLRVQIPMHSTGFLLGSLLSSLLRGKGLLIGGLGDIARHGGAGPQTFPPWILGLIPIYSLRPLDSSRAQRNVDQEVQNYVSLESKSYSPGVDTTCKDSVFLKGPEKRLSFVRRVHTLAL